MKNIINGINLGEQSDLDLGFDIFLEFMVNNPESETSKSFVEYHEECNSPVCSDGVTPCFTYLIGKEFLVSDWVADEDIPKFLDMIQNEILKRNISEKDTEKWGIDFTLGK